MVERKIKVPKGSAHFRNVYQCVNGEYAIGTNRKTRYSADEILALQCKGEIQIPMPIDDVCLKDQRTIESADCSNNANKKAERVSKEVEVILPDSDLLKVIHYFVSCKITEIMENINDKRQEFNDGLMKAVKNNNTEGLHPMLKDFLKNKTKQSEKTPEENEGFITGICNYFLADKLFSFMDETALITLGMLVREWMEKHISLVKQKKTKTYYLSEKLAKDSSSVLQEFGTVIPTTDVTNMLPSNVDENDESTNRRRKSRLKKRKPKQSNKSSSEKIRPDRPQMNLEGYSTPDLVPGGPNDGMPAANTVDNEMDNDLRNTEILSSGSQDILTQVDNGKQSKKRSFKHSSSKRKVLKLMKKRRTMF